MARHPTGDTWTIEDEEWSRPFGPPMADEVRRGAANVVGTCVVSKARAMTRVLTAMVDSALAPHGVKVTQLLVLAALADRGGTSLRDLCVMLGTLESTSSRALGIMVRNGWIYREPAPRPRWYWFTLTHEGADVLRRALPAWEAANAAAAAVVRRELHVVTRMARRAIRIRARRTLWARSLRTRWRERARHTSRVRNAARRAARLKDARPRPRSPP